MSLEQIAHNIRFFRDRQEWTQMELAEKLMVSRSVIAKWENYSTTPDISSLMKLSNVFRITLDQLVGNHSYRDDLLKDFKQIYSSKSKPFDEEVVDLIEYIMTHPNFKDQIYRLKNLPIRKQLSLHTIFAGIIDQYEKI
ncbi:helix-turn-helix transcriptional regulator [Virgibacillus sp. NKC19-16]|uniref:helix-turn-helix domain-containing protein n=1 Tax=Virgibacillus salidurans TaxID=2831673 RepID=UPI001F37452B|nr:helix-turn-helix transcriptional regulator [Virgibacillus sp. NKC19-16]UJL47310.1 helix-turn-helix transcriptional regulator [Virgibacillus sp. NKC19-16]